MRCRHRSRIELVGLLLSILYSQRKYRIHVSGLVFSIAEVCMCILQSFMHLDIHVRAHSLADTSASTITNSKKHSNSQQDNVHNHILFKKVGQQK